MKFINQFSFFYCCGGKYHFSLFLVKDYNDPTSTSCASKYELFKNFLSKIDFCTGIQKKKLILNHETLNIDINLMPVNVNMHQQCIRSKITLIYQLQSESEINSDFK